MHLHMCLVISYLLNRGSYIMCHYVLSFVLRLRYPHKKRCSFRLYLQFLQEGSCLIYVICDYLRIMVSNTYAWCFCFVFLCLLYPIVHIRLPLRYSLTRIEQILNNIIHKFLQLPTDRHIVQRTLIIHIMLNGNPPPAKT